MSGYPGHTYCSSLNQFLDAMEPYVQMLSSCGICLRKGFDSTLIVTVYTCMSNTYSQFLKDRFDVKCIHITLQREINSASKVFKAVIGSVLVLNIMGNLFNRMMYPAVLLHL